MEVAPALGSHDNVVETGKQAVAGFTCFGEIGDKVSFRRNRAFGMGVQHQPQESGPGPGGSHYERHGFVCKRHLRPASFQDVILKLANEHNSTPLSEIAVRTPGSHRIASSVSRSRQYIVSSGNPASPAKPG